MKTLQHVHAPTGGALDPWQLAALHPLVLTGRAALAQLWIALHAETPIDAFRGGAR
jgi:hypothetical protein